MTRRGRAVALSVTALLVTLATPATGQPAARTLTVTGAANAYADVTFSSPFRLGTTWDTAPRIEGSGTYGGVYVTPLRDSGPAAGTILLRGLPLLDDVPFPLGTTKPLPAGRYRVHLLGDAPTTVRLRAEGLRRDVLVRTATRSDVTATLLRRGVAGVAVPVDRTVLPLTIRRPTLAVVAGAHESTGFAGRRGICVRPRAQIQSPCLQGTSGYGWYYGVIPLNWGLAGAAVFAPGRLSPGEFEAEFLDYTVGAPKGLYAFSITLN